MLHTPITGQLMFRDCGSNGSIVVGVLQLPREFDVVEGAAYLLTLWNGEVNVHAQQIDAGIPAERLPDGVSSWLRAPMWRRVAAPQALCVRFLEAFPESNTWVVFGPSQVYVLSTELRAGQTHAWFSIQSGRLGAIEAPMDATGDAIPGVLRTPIWPAPDGLCYGHSQHLSSIRPDYLRFSRLQVSVARGELSMQDAKAAINSDERLSLIGWSGSDQQYLAYLSAVEHRHGLHLDGPCSASDIAERDKASREIIREIMIASRKAQLSSLEAQLKAG